ncbi:hypothetical protein [Polycladidibacter hongkongensis]|uniref:hypothetical protein n=1 Tax=Polycladidibacter hongkongensis TaxID=1647556 RepID=UPI000833D046|nr:hypothetical protein [Pseudovibrio hongkongensis]
MGISGPISTNSTMSLSSLAGRLHKEGLDGDSNAQLRFGKDGGNEIYVKDKNSIGGTIKNALLPFSKSAKLHEQKVDSFNLIKNLARNEITNSLKFNGLISSDKDPKIEEFLNRAMANAGLESKNASSSQGKTTTAKVGDISALIDGLRSAVKEATNELPQATSFNSFYNAATKETVINDLYSSSDNGEKIEFENPLYTMKSTGKIQNTPNSSRLERQDKVDHVIYDIPYEPTADHSEEEPVYAQVKKGAKERVSDDGWHVIKNKDPYAMVKKNL